MNSIFRPSLLAVLLLSITLASIAIAADDLVSRVSLLEAKASHLQTQEEGFRSLVSQGIKSLNRNKDGYVDVYQVTELQNLNRKAAGDILSDSEALQNEAVRVLKEEGNSLGLLSVQQGETASVGDRLFAIIQITRCVDFGTQLVSQNQYVPEALSLATEVADGCKNLVSAIRKDQSSANKKKTEKKITQ